jgi:hypothetical protein
MKSQNLEPEVVVLENRAEGGWIGSSKAKEVLLYFDGMCSDVGCGRVF